MALEPGLSGLLLFDATPERALAIARLLARMYGAVHGHPRVAVLPSSASEEEIWGAPRLPVNQEGVGLPRRRGILSPLSEGGGHIVVVPDLARISLSGARAVVTHAGSEVSVLERDGESAASRPAVYWIATLARSQVGEVSPHLLDRFPLRVTVAGEPAADRGSEILAWVMADDTIRGGAGPESLAEAELVERIRSAPVEPSRISSDVLSQVLAYFPASDTPGIRRPLALARFARAWARLHGNLQVTAGHVAETARLAGLELPVALAPGAPVSGVAVPVDTLAEPVAAEWPALATAPGFPGVVAELPVTPAEPAEGDEQVFPATEVAPPYPEDDTPPTREAFSLQLPPMSGHDSSAGGGVPIGTRRVSDMRDIAVVSTVLEAAKYQRVRPPLPGGGIRVTPLDLRGYRRLPVPERVLALVLDYTSFSDSRWRPALVPYLKWAYVSRASMLLVQVGARSAPEPLRATQIAARNLLSPQVRAAFEEGPGNATPLAHGLNLAAQALQRAFTQGRARVRAGLLVVVTDGRGNVPLDASLAGALRGRVMRQGVEDALVAARALGAIRGLARVVLHPSPQQYPHLPLELAEAMDATTQAMSLVQPVVEPA